MPSCETYIRVQVIRVGETMIYEEDRARTTSPFSPSKLPFGRKTFITSPEIDCGDISAHLSGLEVVRGVSSKRQKTLDFSKAIVNAASTLIE